MPVILFAVASVGTCFDLMLCGNTQLKAHPSLPVQSLISRLALINAALNVPTQRQCCCLGLRCDASVGSSQLQWTCQALIRQALTQATCNPPWSCHPR